jgi:hypothetical protein
MGQKDNLTDVIEQLPKVDTSANDLEDRNDQQVVAGDGEIVTLGQN